MLIFSYNIYNKLIMESNLNWTIKINEKNSSSKEVELIEIRAIIKDQLNFLKDNYKDKKFDYNKDWVVNELEDFRKYVDDIVENSKILVIKELELKWKLEDEELYIKLIEEIENINSKELSLIIVQEIVAELTKIIWIDFTREVNKKERKKMVQYPTKKTDIIKVQNILQENWTTEYTDFKQEWPVLILFPEIHYAWDILKDNFHASLSIKDYYLFSATEWYDRKIEANYIHELESLNQIIETNQILMSSFALEELLWKTIDTIWVEPKNFLLIVKKLQASLKWKQINTNKFSDMTYKEFIVKMNESKNKSKIFENIGLKYRNYHWLKNIQEKILNYKNNWKNIIPITIWQAHADNLIVQAKQRWFWWVIYFEPNAFNKRIDLKKISEAYKAGQGIK